MKDSINWADVMADDLFFVLLVEVVSDEVLVEASLLLAVLVEILCAFDPLKVLQMELRLLADEIYIFPLLFAFR